MFLPPEQLEAGFMDGFCKMIAGIDATTSVAEKIKVDDGHELELRWVCAPGVSKDNAKERVILYFHGGG